MARVNKAVNAGVHGASGLEFQKHCALYIFFDQYKAIKEKNYFICLEHHEDFLFCYKDTDGLVVSIDAYQAKKASSPWGLLDELFELVHKIVSVGLDLNADDIPKSDDYFHSLKFVTNNSITLKNGKKKPNAKSELINESNNNVAFTSLDATIIAKIISELKTRQKSQQVHINELNSFSLLYLDLPRTFASQKDSLVGLFGRAFGNQVIDQRAAVDTLLSLFRDAENYINNGGVAKLLDPCKRVESSTIQDALKVINSKQKAFDFWRSKEDKICEMLAIPVFDQSNFSLQFTNSFDLFKDLKQTEHQKILRYVVSNKSKWARHTSESACIDDIYTSFIADNRTNLQDLDVKATIFAAYFELKG